MISFNYNALDGSGSNVQGVIEAEDRQGALHALDSRGLFPTDLTAAGNKPAPPQKSSESSTQTAPSPARTATPIQPGQRLSGRVTRKEIAAMTRELAALLEATIPIPAALDGLGQQEENVALKELLLGVSAAVRQGTPLSAALAGYPKLFPALYTSMVEVGEEAGALDTVLTDLADLLEHEEEVRSEVVGAVAYPCFVLGMGVVTTVVLLVFVMPKLFAMMQGMMSTLPTPTRILLTTSEFFQNWWGLVLAGMIVAGIGLRAYLRTESGALWWDGFKLRLPVLGPVFRASALGRFARTLGTLEKTGVSLLPALEIVRNTVGNRRVALGIDQVAEEARAGDRLAGPLRRLEMFPPTMVQMIGVGEETGRLGTMLLKVATIQERMVKRHSSTLISLLAPSMILVVGALVGFIVISLLLPIFQMSQGLR